MAGRDRAVEQVQEQAHDVLENRWTERLARFGYLAKGVVYVLLGILSLQAAFGVRAAPSGTQDALYTVLTQPFGRFLLLLLAVGLLGYVLWRVTQAFLDPEHTGEDAQALLQRAGYLLSGFAYAAVAFTALQLARGTAGGGRRIEDWTAVVLAHPFGQLLVALAGLGIAGYGLAQLYEAYSAKFREHFKVLHMEKRTERYATYLGRFGYAARGLIYLLIGLFLLRAAWLSQAEAATGLGELLAAFAQAPYGPWILALAGLGLLAYGLFEIFESRYRELNLQ